MKGFLRFLVYALLLAYAETGRAQTGEIVVAEEFVIDFIDVRDGLISNYVTKTVNDAGNIKYFATEGGMSRFDGYSFKSYQPGHAYTGLLNENIETLFSDADNNIWIGTKSGGLSMLDVRHDKIRNFNSLFKEIRTDSHLRVVSINQDAAGNIWVGTWANGVFVIDWKAEKLVHHYSFNTPIRNIIRDKYDNVWFVSAFQLLKFDARQERLVRYSLPHSMSNLVEDPYRNRIWIVGNSKLKVRLLSFHISDQTIETQPIDLEARFVNTMAIDDKKRLWLGSWGDGLFISDSSVSAFQRINTSPRWSGRENINHSIILDIEIDKNGIAWLSTAHGGVLMLYPNKGFSLITNSRNAGRKDHNIISIYKDPGGELLIGTLAEGLLTRQDKGFDSPARIPNTRVNVIKEQDDFIFVGTNAGLFVVRDGDFDNALLRFPGKKVTAVCLDRKKNLWVGTQQTGLRMTNVLRDSLLTETKLYSEKGKGRYYIDNNRINKITEDEVGNIWIATYSGLNLYDAENGSIIPHTTMLQYQLPSVIINDFCVRDETVYLGTPAGLVKLKYADRKLEIEEIYGIRNGLINEFICALQEDDNGNIWMSTTTSVARFDPFKKTFLNYDRQDGVMVNSFHIGSSFKDQDGFIYFGGSNGAVTFHPNKFDDTFTTPDVVFTGLIVNNKNYQVGEEVDGHALLTSDINYTEKLELGYKQNHLTLIFAANDFFGTKNIAYQYKLTGYQNEWVNTGRRNEISFTGLRPGTYSLQVRASREKENWGEPRSLLIVVDVPPWSTWYAYVSYCLIAIGLGLLIRYVSTRQARLQARLRIAEIEKEKEHDVNEAKIAFFTNISHEFRTPLTLILSPVTEMLSDLKINAGVRDKMILVENNARRLLNLINQLLDFRKSEHGLLKLNVLQGDFVGFANEVYLSFKDIARTKGIDYRFESEVDKALLHFDRDKMEIVLCNLISNAFKYTRSGGDVVVRMYTDEIYLNIEVRDNGIGLSPEETTKVFDRFYQVQTAETSKMVGSGIGLAFTKNIVDLHYGNILVRSTPGRQTCFTTQLLLDNNRLRGEHGAPDNRLEILTNDYANQLGEAWVDQQSLDIADDGRTERVLVVDDNDDVRKYLRSMLQDEYKVFEADNGVSGLALAKRELPDIIVSDIMMPEMDGITFCHEIKSQIITSHIPIILLTARTSVVYEVNGLETGADDYVTKPFNPIIMKTRIHSILENRKKLRAHFLNKVRFEPDKTEVDDGNIDEAFIERAIELVNANLMNESFGIETMVNELCMSQSTLYRKIKSLTGLSTTGFVRSIRLKKAAQLILSDNMKLSQVAGEVGFNDYKHFRLSFQQQFGCLPSDYKAAMLDTLKTRIDMEGK